MKNLLLVLNLFVCPVLLAQTFFTTKKYPATQFRYPLDTTASLVGNFGECRPNHFHSGIDMRTFGKENLKILAIEDGFVSRIKIEPGGFGNAIYITHFNGYTSVYAHLNKFFNELEQYVQRKQYETQRWEQDILLPPHEFPIKKGRFIAWSGNTGSSQGPHLHLEIRDTKTEAPLNGLLFYQSLRDNKPPKLKQIAVYNGDLSINSQDPQLYSVINTNGINKLATATLQVDGSKAFLGFVADDFMEIATGTLGVYEMRMYLDGKPHFAWQMDNISYDITRYMNAIADYKVKKKGGPWVQLCRKLPNDKLPIYKSFTTENGMIDLSDGKIHSVRIELYDTKYNKSSIELELKGKTEASEMPPCITEFKCGKPVKFSAKEAEFILDENALYDDLCFEFDSSPSKNAKAKSPCYKIHYGNVPIHSYFNLKLKPNVNISSIQREKIAMVRLPYGNETNAKGKAAKWENGFATSLVRDFGNYELVIDDLPPLITTALKDGTKITNLKRLTFTIKEETTSVAKVTATCYGQWLRLVQKGNAYYYEMDKFFPNGTHTLLITAVDENGNSTSKALKLIK